MGAGTEDETGASSDVAPVAAVALPTRDRAEHLRVCLESLLAQDLAEPFEIIVIDDGSADHTREVVGRLALQAPAHVTVRYERQDRLGINAGRNRAATLARAELVCLVDDDVCAPPGWLGSLVAAAREHPRADALGGPITLRIEGREPRHCRVDRLPETQLNRGPAMVWDSKLYGANLAFRVASWRRIGPFREDMGVGDEEEWEDRLLRSGGHTLYVPAAGVWHRRTQRELTRAYLIRRSYRTGYSQLPYLLQSGQRVTLLSRVVRAVRGLAHALVFRCFYGVLRASRHWGEIARLWELRSGRGPAQVGAASTAANSAGSTSSARR